MALDTSGTRTSIGLIAGGGRLPFLFARAAREQGLRVVAAAHRGETDQALELEVDRIEWVRVGQLARILATFRAEGVRRAVMAGGIGKVRALREIRPDLGAFAVMARLRSLRDDALLRGVASYFESAGVDIVAPTDYLKRLLAPEGHLAGPSLSQAQEADVALGREVARAIGRADVGQTVVVGRGNVLAVEAIEGTDETIRRGGRLGGAGSVVVKISKPGQDARFDLPAVGAGTLAIMGDVGARVLAVEAEKTILLDAEALTEISRKEGISIVGIR